MGKVLDEVIAIGRQVCDGCKGAGYVWPAPADVSWLRCALCDGLGTVWISGGPRFGCSIQLGDRKVGEVVELATGHRAKILWHVPRKDPDTTFVALIDDFTDTTDGTPVPVDANLGVVSVAARVVGSTDPHDGEKDADAVDPFARRVRARAGGPLL